ncbi:MAG: class I SAM-dependent methyltransferase [Candidatus Sulfotelmatobacter sp.]|jgi:SAM-dependent methyltransferase
MSAIGVVHEKLVLNRRVATLARWFAQLTPRGASVLDVGCGDGLISAVLQSQRPDLKIRGLDVLPRTHTHIPVEIFDGRLLPYNHQSFDVVLFSDVLHHTPDPAALLCEATRVASQSVLIKDHNRNGLWAGARLRLMDWVGNARFGVALPYNYWTECQWREAWQELGLCPERLVTDLGLYPLPANWIFGAKLHFVVLLTKRATSGR